MTEDELEARDSSNGCPRLECLVVVLGVLEVILVVAIYLW